MDNLSNNHGGLLYAVVSPQTDSTVTKLAVTFSKGLDTYGTFALSGDVSPERFPPSVA